MTIITSPISSNIWTVTDLNFAIKQTIEKSFTNINIKAEISGLKLHSSGHLYLTLKDEKSILNAVCWRHIVSHLSFKPEDGLEVICEGNITTFPSQSKYQLTITKMRPSGVGTLMAMLEKRKKQLSQEGLFDPQYKKPLPKFPKIIGVVTSPTGAVIQDIIHRLTERYPLTVLLWPVLVQGERAAEQIVQAIQGFNQFREETTYQRPDLLIVARGGGSIEDLWPFNEENVVRAVFASTIPIISAVGHETDTTLIDFVSDKRAPTPTAAAEIATPDKQDLVQQLSHYQRILTQTATRIITHKTQLLRSLSNAIIHPSFLLQQKQHRLDSYKSQLNEYIKRHMMHQMHYFNLISSRMTKELIERKLDHWFIHFSHTTKLLESYHHQKILERGFTYLTDKDEKIVMRKKQVKNNQPYALQFFDGTITVIPTDALITKRKQKPLKTTENLTLFD